MVISRAGYATVETSRRKEGTPRSRDRYPITKTELRNWRGSRRSFPPGRVSCRERRATVPRSPCHFQVTQLQTLIRARNQIRMIIPSGRPRAHYSSRVDNNTTIGAVPRRVRIRGKRRARFDAT